MSEGYKSPILTGSHDLMGSHDLPPQPPTAPTSHNFTKQRDKMRQKLEEKKKKRDHDSGKPGRVEREGGWREDEQRKS